MPNWNYHENRKLAARNILSIFTALVLILQVFGISWFNINDEKLSNIKIANALVDWVGTNNIAYNPITGANARVSFTTGNSIEISMALDSKGNPHLAWSDGTTGNEQIYYVRWQGSQWITADGSSFTGTNANVSNSTYESSDPYLVLDSSDNPHLAWSDHIGANDEIIYIKWNGTSWTNVNGTTYNGSNASISNNTGDSIFPKLVLDSIGMPCIAWADDSPGNREIFYVHWNGSAWVTANGNPYSGLNGNITQNTSTSFICSLKLDSNNNPCIAWEDQLSGTFDVYYISYNSASGMWTNVQGQVYPGFSALVSKVDGRDSGLPCLAMDGNGRPCISWQDNGTPTGNSNIFFARWDGTNWTNAFGQNISTNSANVSNSNFGAGSSSLVIMNDGNPALAWHDYSAGNSEIFLAFWNGNNWANANGAAVTGTNANISTNSGLSYRPMLFVDANGKPMVAWDDGTPGNQEIFFTRFENDFDGSFELTKSVDTNNDGLYEDNGKTVASGDTLKYKINWKFNQKNDPLENPYLYDTIPEGMTYVSGSASPNDNLSYSVNGGSTWTAGEPPNGSPAGTMLRWDLSSLWAGAGGSQYIGGSFSHPKDINVSRTTTRSVYDEPSIGQCSERIQLDSKGNPHIVWEEYVNSNNWEIFYVYWNGTNWVNETGQTYDPLSGNANISNTTNMSVLPSFRLTTIDTPIICWSEGTNINNTDICMIKWLNGTWVNINNSTYNPLTNNANISNNGGWSIFSDLELDKNDNPCIVWDDFSYGGYSREIMYIRWDGNKWVNINGSVFDSVTGNAKVSQNGGASCDPALEIDNFGNPVIAWDDYSYGLVQIMLVKWNGVNWVNIDGSIYNSSIGSTSLNQNVFGIDPQLKIGKDGFPRLYWLQLIGNFEMSYLRWNGQNWVNVYGVVYDPLLNNQNLTNDNSDSWPGTLMLDSNDNPHFSWHNGGYEIEYVYWNGNNLISNSKQICIPNTVISNVSNSVGNSMYSALVLDGLDNPYIIWREKVSGNDELYFVRKSLAFQFSFSVKVDNPAEPPAMCNKSTFRHKWDNGISTESNDVCNQISYSFTGKVTLEKSVDTNNDGKYTDNDSEVDQGTRLDYRIKWTFDNPNRDPLFGAYVYDKVRPGTTYIKGSASTLMLSHSLDDGKTWKPGEPSDGAKPGTVLRWGPISYDWVGAALNQYKPKSLVQSTDVNVSQNSGTDNGYVGGVSVQVDSKGNQHVCWADTTYGSGDIYYVKWDQTKMKWVCADGTAYMPNVNGKQNVSRTTGQSGQPKLALDSNDNPHIVWMDDSYAGMSWEALYVHWDPAKKKWLCANGNPYNPLGNAGENISRNNHQSRNPFICLDKSNVPHIAWNDGHNSFGENDVYLVKWSAAKNDWVGIDGVVYIPDGTGSHEVNPSGVDSDFECLALDGAGNPHLTWTNVLGSPTVRMSYVKWNSATNIWVCADGTAFTPVSPNQYVNILNANSHYSSLCIDSKNQPHIAWTQSTDNSWGISATFDINYIKWDSSSGKWTCVDGSAYNPGTSGPHNVSQTSKASINSVLRLDSYDRPAIVWEDWTNSLGDVYFVRWNSSSSGWVDYAGNPYSGTSSNKANVSRNSGDFRYPAFTLDGSSNPHIVWMDRRLTSTETLYVQLAKKEFTFSFSVKTDKPFEDKKNSPICNKAWFAHVFDNGNMTLSNQVCVKIKEKKAEKKPKLVVTKIPKSSQYGEKDIFEFVITVKNIGDGDADHLKIIDVSPRELIYVSSSPAGIPESSNVKFELDTLKAGESVSFTLRFMLSDKTKIDGCQTFTNEAMVVTNKHPTVKASANIKVCESKDTSTGPVNVIVDWVGVDKKGNGKVGESVKVSIKPESGTPPFEMEIDWGDGTKTKGYTDSSDESLDVEHTYKEPGTYVVTIIVKDKYLGTKVIKRTIVVKP